MRVEIEADDGNRNDYDARSVTYQILPADSPDLAIAIDDLEAAMGQLHAAALVDEEAVQDRDRVLAFCAKHADALHRSCPQGHLTGSGLVIDPARRQTLLIHHRKLDLWLQPGGHADGDGNLAGVAMKEVREETGLTGLRVISPAIDVDIHVIPERPNEPEHLHLDLRFVLLCAPHAIEAPNAETKGARWFDEGDPMVSGPDSSLGRTAQRGFDVCRELGLW